MPTIADAFARNLRRLREDRGLSQSELAQKIGADRNTVSRWERGVGGATLSTLKTLANTLGVEETELVVAAPPAPRDHSIEECLRRIAGKAGVTLGPPALSDEAWALFEANAPAEVVAELRRLLNQPKPAPKKAGDR